MNVRNILMSCSIALLIGLPACSTSSGTETTDQAVQTQAMQQSDDHADDHADEHAADGKQKEKKKKKKCPMQVEGTTSNVQQLDGSVAVDFTTTGDVDELRRRVQHMAQKHGQMHGDKGHGDKGHGEKSEKRRQKMEMMANTTANTEEIDGGMRMVLTPQNPEQAEILYEHMQKHVDKMGTKECPMMGKGKGKGKGKDKSKAKEAHENHGH